MYANIIRILNYYIIMHKYNRNMQHIDTYKNQLVTGIRTTTNGGHLWI